MNSKNILVIFFLHCAVIIFGQSVWPGDVNNNGIVNKVDLIYLGYAFGETGAARTTVSTDWEAKTQPENWAGNFPNGLNFLFADANGDGIVNELDAAIILANIDLTHNDVVFTPDEIIAGIKGQDPSCEFVNTPPAAPVDQLFNLEIGLGNSAIPLDNVAGFTFTLSIEPNALKLNNTQLTFNQDAWIDPNEEQSYFAQQPDADKIKLKVAYTKTDRIPVSGGGPIAKVSFLIEGDIVNLLTIDTVTFTLDSISVLDGDLNLIPVASNTLHLPIDRDLKVSTKEHPKLASIEVYPNPNKGFLLIESLETRVEYIEIINSLGQSVLQQKLSPIYFQGIDIQELNTGLYWVKIHSDYGIKTRFIHKF